MPLKMLRILIVIINDDFCENLVIYRLLNAIIIFHTTASEDFRKNVSTKQLMYCTLNANCKLYML